VPPVRAWDVLPPVAQITRAYRSAWHSEHRAARPQQLRARTGIERRIERPFSKRHIAGRGDERGEVGIGDGVAVDPEAIESRCGPAAPRDNAHPIPSGRCLPESVPCRRAYRSASRHHPRDRFGRYFPFGSALCCRVWPFVVSSSQFWS